MTDLQDFVSTEHPLYTRNAPRWMVSRDFYNGGHFVTTPTRPIGRLGFWDMRAAVEDSRVSWTWLDRVVNSYLYSHERESYNRWLERSKRAVHYPLLQRIVDIYAEGVLAGGVQIDDDATGEPWATYFADVDLTANTIDEWRRMAIIKALVFGRCHAITDRLNYDAEMVSRAEQLARGDRPYSVLLSPLEVINWSLDRMGNFDMVALADAGPDNAPSDVEFRKVWTRAEWALYGRQTDTGGSGKRDGWQLYAGGSHNLGVVPLTTLVMRRTVDAVSQMDAVSPFDSALDVDRDVFNLDSLENEILYGQTFSTLCVQSDGSASPFELGTGTVLTVPIGAQMPTYIGPDIAQVEAIRTSKQAKVQLIRDLVGVSRGQQEQSAQVASGESLAYQSDEKYKRMCDFATAAQSFEIATQNVVATFEGLADAPGVQYKKLFDVRGLDQALSDATALQALGTSQVAMAPLVASLLGQAMRQAGIDDDDISESKDIIEKDAQEEEDAAGRMATLGGRGAVTDQYDAVE